MRRTIAWFVLLALFISALFTPLSTSQGVPLQILSNNVVIEGQQFLITITDDQGTPIYNALVICGTYAGESPGGYYTNRNGMVQVVAPTISETTAIDITANKTGYLNASYRITVIDSTQTQLVITAPSRVLEGTSFEVEITVADTIPLPDTSITFLDRTVTTSSDGKVTLVAPRIDVNSEYILSAAKEGFISANKQIVVENEEIPKTNEELQLTITAPSSVNEQTDFEIHITANNTPVSLVQVHFNGGVVETNTTGVALVTAPTVEEDTSLQIDASKEGYHDATVSIIIRNIDSFPPKGWIVGSVVNSFGEPIADAQICITNATTNNCTTSDSQGGFILSTVPGIYTLTAEKTGYIAYTLENILVKADTSVQTSIVLTESVPNDWGDYAIQYGTEQGLIGATIAVNNDNTREIELYNSDITITMIPSAEGSFTFTIAAANGTKPTVIAVEITDLSTLFNTTIADLQHISVTFDGRQVPLAQNFQEIFESTTIEEPLWAGLLTENKFYCTIAINHFSSHTITLSTVSESFSSTMLLLYLACFLLTVTIGSLFMKRVWKK